MASVRGSAAPVPIWRLCNHAAAAPIVLLAAVLLAGPWLSGCDGCSNSAVAPAPQAAIPAGLSVEIQIDGQPQPAIDSARLAALPPDHQDDGRRAWRLTSLLGDKYEPGKHSVVLQDSAGGNVMLAQAGAKDGKLVVVGLTREGSLRVALAAPDEPFPKFHGRGGHRGRQGDPARVKDVARISLISKERPAIDNEPPLSLAVTVNGEPRSWSDAELRGVASKAFSPGDGEGQRPAWSLREMASKLAGQGARVVSVSGEDGHRLELAEAAWNDDKRIPLLRLNRRGQLKFAWVAPDLSPLDGDALRGVEALEIVRAGAEQ